jgi:hypothetical protein
MGYIFGDIRDAGRGLIHLFRVSATTGRLYLGLLGFAFAGLGTAAYFLWRRTAAVRKSGPAGISAG